MAHSGDPVHAGIKSEVRRILIVEDEAVIAVYLDRLIAELGHVTVGPAQDLPSALAAVESGGFDCALVDMYLGKLSAAPVARALMASGIPFALSTAADQQEVREFQAVPMLAKPFTESEVRSMIRSLVQIST